jgi:hypothetical protein
VAKLAEMAEASLVGYHLRALWEMPHP